MSARGAVAGCLVGLLAAGAVCAPATLADEPPAAAVAAAHVGADALLRAALTVAQARNTRMHGPAPLACATQLYVYDDARADVIAESDTPGCRIYWTRIHRDESWLTYTDTALPRDERAEAAAEVCQVAAHEDLHSRGFGHSARGLMAPRLDPAYVPAACMKWARGLVRR